MFNRILSFVGSVLTAFVLLVYGASAVAMVVFFYEAPAFTQKYGVLSYVVFMLLWSFSLIVLNMAALAYTIKRRSKAEFMELTRGEGYSFVLSGLQLSRVMWYGTTAIARNAAYSRPIRLWAAAIKYVGSLHIAALLALLILNDIS